MVIRPGSFAHTPSIPELFGRASETVLEIGFGDGRFLAALAQKNPERNYLGAEISRVSAQRGLARLWREDLDQVKIFVGDGVLALRHLFFPGSLAAIYANFPDPWPKRRHAERRLASRDFFALASSRLQPGGSFFLTTDHEGYFAFALSEAQASGVFATKVLPPPPETLKTKYALQWQAQGKPIFHAQFQRSAVAELELAELGTEEMLHVILTGEFPKGLVLEHQAYPIPGGHAVILETWSAPESKILFLLRIEEQALNQEMIFELRPSHSGIYLGLHPFAEPLATAGVHSALKLLTVLLQAHGLQVQSASF